MFYLFRMCNSIPTDGREAGQDGAFQAAWAAASRAPLTEISPHGPGDRAAALGFALAWAMAAGGDGPIAWAAPDVNFAEDGAPHGEGLSRFGVKLDRLLLINTRTQIDALWACEQALRTPGAIALCAVAPEKKALSLTATRRLLLNAESGKTRCILLRMDGGGASAAWTRWRIGAAPSEAVGLEIGAPRFAARLERNRAGPSGLSWIVDWNAHDHAFHAQMDASVDSAFADGPAAPRQRRAG